MNYKNDNGAFLDGLIADMRVLLEQAGAIKKCPLHKSQFIRQGERAMRDARDAAFEDLHGGRLQGPSLELMSIAITRALDETPEDCTLCAAMRRDNRKVL